MTPQGQLPGPGPQPTGWFQKNWMWVVGGGCAVMLGCCGLFSVIAVVLDQNAKPADASRVDCGEPGPGGVACELARTAGTGAYQACWDLEIACTNGAKMLGHACGTVGAGQAGSTVTMPTAAFSNQDGCDAPARGEVKNLVITSTD